jgi:nucleotide-binding universal stress UspA family protein
MFERILIATDLSPSSLPAFERGLTLARRLGAKVIVLHVSEPPYSAHPWFEPLASKEAALFTDVAEREQAKARDLLDAKVADVVRSGAIEQSKIEVVVQSGVPADRIVEVAGRRECDLIVVGTHGRTGLKHALLGSVAERIARTAAQPVLIVHGTP